MSPYNGPTWGDPGVTEQLNIQEAAIPYPGAAGGPATRTLQRAGLLKRLRFWARARLNVTVHAGGAETPSALGPLGGYINNISIKANGQIDLINLSGFGAAVYNEVQNRDGSVMAAAPQLALNSVPGSADLVVYDTIGAAATGDFNAAYPFEFQFALPFNVSRRVEELGLWLLQNQSIDVGITINFNVLQQTAATPNAIWSGVVLTGTPTLANCMVDIERELYNIPNVPEQYPNLMWAHQVIEFVQPWTGNFSRFPIPRAGLLLRAIMIHQDSAGAAIENTEITSLKYVYGSNETPIDRPGWVYNHEYQMDYGRKSPKGVCVLDFYKFGDNGLKLVKSTEDLANLRLETTFGTTAAGTQRIILDRLIPVAAR